MRKCSLQVENVRLELKTYEQMELKSYFVHRSRYLKSSLPLPVGVSNCQTITSIRAEKTGGQFLWSIFVVPVKCIMVLDLTLPNQSNIPFPHRTKYMSIRDVVTRFFIDLSR